MALTGDECARLDSMAVRVAGGRDAGLSFRQR
jgi:hypothetical protein